MKFLVLFLLVSVAFAQEVVEVIEDTREGPLGAVYSYLVSLDNGIRLQETGSEGSVGQSVAQGTYEFVSPEGNNVLVSYTADEGGFQPQSDAIPVPPPMPEHALQQIAFAAEQRAAGVEWDQQGFVI